MSEARNAEPAAPAAEQRQPAGTPAAAAELAAEQLWEVSNFVTDYTLPRAAETTVRGFGPQQRQGVAAIHRPH